jgi:hypothetical protein
MLLNLLWLLIPATTVFIVTVGVVAESSVLEGNGTFIDPLQYLPRVAECSDVLMHCLSSFKTQGLIFLLQEVMAAAGLNLRPLFRN